MAAPGSVYSPKIWYKYDTTQTGNAGVLIQLPRALQQYAIEANTDDSTTPPTVPTYASLTTAQKTTTTDAWFTSAFHVDLVKHYNYVVPNTNPAETMYCLCGWLQDTVNGTTSHTDNWNLHNMSGSYPTNRQGKPRITISETVGNTTTVRGYVLCNDGGLNTKPWIAFGTYDPTVTPHDVEPVISVNTDRIVFRMNYRNAYYLNTTSIRVEVYLVSSPQQIGTGDRYREFNLSGLNMSAKYEEYAAGNTPLQLAIKMSDNGLPWSQYQANATVKLRLIISNAEGTYMSDYTSVYTVAYAPQYPHIYRLDNPNDPNDNTSASNLSKNPTTEGIEYILGIDPAVDGGYTGLGYPQDPYRPKDSSMWRPAEHEEQSQPSYTYAYPTLYNLIGGDPWANPVTASDIGAIQQYDPNNTQGTTRVISFPLCGCPANDPNGDPTASPLPAGMYFGIPTVSPGERGQEAVPASMYEVVPHLPNATAYKPVVYINSSGYPFAWSASTYNSGGGGGGGGGGTAILSDLSVEMYDFDYWVGYYAPDNYQSYCSSATFNQQTRQISFAIYPKVTIKGQGRINMVIRCRIYDSNSNLLTNSVLTSNPVQSVADVLPSTTTTRTFAISQSGIEYKQGNEVAAFTGVIELDPNEPIEDAHYYAELSVVQTSDPGDDGDDPSPTPSNVWMHYDGTNFVDTWSGYPVTELWDIAYSAYKNGGGGEEEPK